MKARGVNEDDAYALLIKPAMDQGKRLADVAENLVTAAGLLSWPYTHRYRVCPVDGCCDIDSRPRDGLRGRGRIGAGPT